MEKIDNLGFLNKEDTYSLALMLLYFSNDNPRYSTLSELPFILDHESFIKFIKYYEGQKLEIPTMDQIKDSLRVLMLFQYSRIEKDDWHTALSKSGFSREDSVSAKHKLDKFCNQLERYNCLLGGVLGETNRR